MPFRIADGMYREAALARIVALVRVGEGFLQWATLSL